MTPQAFPGEWPGREVRVVGLRGSGARASEGEGRALGKAGAGHSPLLSAGLFDQVQPVGEEEGDAADEQGEPRHEIGRAHV